MKECCTTAVTTACASLERQLAEALAQVQARATDTPDAATNAYLLDLLAKLLKLHKGNEHTWSSEQKVIREAKAVLAEHGR